MSRTTARTICWLCYKVAPNLKGILRHMAAVHAHDPNFHICCGMGHARTYVNFKKHVYRRHRDNLEMADPFTITSGEPNTHTGGIGSDESLWNGDNDPELEREDNFCTVTKLQQKQQMALFLLKTRKVSQVALDGIIEDFTPILQETIHRLREEVNSYLIENGLSITTFDGLPGIFDNPTTPNPFSELESKYKQEKFCRQHLVFLESYF